MATKHHLNNEDNLEETDELKDSEVPEMGDEGILTPKNAEEAEFDDVEEDDDLKITEEE